MKLSNRNMEVIENDISSANFKFDPMLGTSFRDRIRDIIDSVVRRPFYKLFYRGKFSQLTYRIELALPEKGMSSFARRRWVNRYNPIKNSRILILGCGTGWDLGSWLYFRPKEIIGVDLYNFSACWKKIKYYVSKSNLPTEINFYQLDIAELDKARLGKFDIISSDAVFEHCRTLKQSMKILYDLLNTDGIIYASYGPLWYCWGGDHFSGRGGIGNGYNHLILDSEDYKDYYLKYLKEPDFELQNGGRFIELDLFSKLSGAEYISIYKQAGFQVKSLIAEFCANALKALKDELLRERLIHKFPELTIEDFFLKSHFVILNKA